MSRAPQPPDSAVGASVAAETGGHLAFVHEALPVRVRFGDGASDRLADELRWLGAHSVVVVASPRHRSLVQRLEDDLGGVPVGLFDDVRQHVPVDLAARAGQMVAERGADALVSIGGGSAVGLAKAVARERPMPQIAVPTTYSGSEMTPIWGMTSNDGKRTGRDPGVLPSVVVYDPALTRSLPPGLAASSGLNAVAHAVEALYAAGRNPITDLAAIEALRRLGRALPQVVEAARARDSGGGEAARAHSDALYGACLAGLALGQVGTSFHHKICHVLGGRFGLGHAETHAALLPHSVRAAAEEVPEALRPAADALGADDAVTGVARLAASVGAPGSLADLGFPPESLEEAADLAAEALRGLGVAPSRARIEALLRDATAGPPGP